VLEITDEEMSQQVLNVIEADLFCRIIDILLKRRRIYHVSRLLRIVYKL
jgi:hypothetical protein